MQKNLQDETISFPDYLHARCWDKKENKDTETQVKKCDVPRGIRNEGAPMKGIRK